MTGDVETDRFDVCVVGSANLDLVATAARIPGPGETVLGTRYAEHPGGKGLNQAVAAARSGSRVAFVGAVGDDAAGAALRRVLADSGIDATRLATTSTPTGRALIVVDEHGENSIVVVPGANAEVIELADASDAGEGAGRASLPPASVLLLQLEVPLPAVIAAARQARLDRRGVVLNPAPARPLPVELLAMLDVIVPNQHEVELLGGVDALLGAGCGAVIVTLGADGAILHRPGVPALPIAAFEVAPVDTTGAGDAFCGALASRLAAGDPIDAAAVWASAAGALATTVEGAVPAQPTRAAISELLAQPTA